MSDETLDVDAHIAELEQRIQDLRQLSLDGSSWRLTRELKRFAKREQRVVAYLTANFYLMNDARSLYEPQAGKEAALENIALLESEELARKFQPDFPEGAYQHTVAWMSTCSYDNLATHIAQMDGYNSEGIHECIADGLQVCRRTGKMECTSCFREYAGSVYRAADDLDMVIHHARAGIAHTAHEGRMDRRWVSGKNLANALSLSGDLNASVEAYQQAVSFIPGYHNKLNAWLDVNIELESLLWLQGRETEWPTLLKTLNPGEPPVAPPLGESPGVERDLALRDAIIATCRGDTAKAIQLLTHWDQLLLSRGCLSHWFETRLRLIATQLLAGNESQAQALGKPLEAKARPARDWLTIRRLTQLLSGEVAPNPLASVKAFTVGPFAPKQNLPANGDSTPSTSTTAESVAAATHGSVVVASPPQTPLRDRIAELQTLCQAAESQELANAAVDELLAIDHASVTDGQDAGMLVWMALLMSGQLERCRDAWNWGRPFVERFSHDAATINVLATLAWAARNEVGSTGEDDTTVAAAADRIATLEQIEKWYRASLDLDSEHARNHARAAQFFWSIDREGEAERCWARSFRLNRSESRVALQLSQVYNATDRRADGLAVLDMCIREGVEDPDLFWDAGLSALALERWELVVTYLDRYEELAAETPWTQYYRALALLELHRPTAALDALDIEAKRSPEHLFGVTLLRAKAHADLGDKAELRQQLNSLLAIPLSSVDYLSLSGLVRLFEVLCTTAASLPESDGLRLDIESLALQAGMLPDAHFERQRLAQPKSEGIHFYVVEIRQPLDEHWPTSHGCLSGQDDWTGYLAHWGVLADDEETAKSNVLAAQSRCYPLPAEIRSVTRQGEGYNDSPGLTWQGRRDSDADLDPDPVE